MASPQASPPWARERVYQYVTGLQILFSGCSLLIICLALPVMYNNVATTLEYVKNEMAFCEVSFHS